MDLLAVEADFAAGVRVEWLGGHPFQGASLGAYLRQPAPRPAFPGRIDRGLGGRVARCSPTTAAMSRAATRPTAGYSTTTSPSSRPDDFRHRSGAHARGHRQLRARRRTTRPSTRGFTRLQRSTGYVPPVLTNVWARAPFGHPRPVAEPRGDCDAARPPTHTVRHRFLDALYDLTAVGVPWQPPGVTSPAGLRPRREPARVQRARPSVPRRPRRRRLGRRRRVPEDVVTKLFGRRIGS